MQFLFFHMSGKTNYFIGERQPTGRSFLFVFSIFYAKTNFNFRGMRSNYHHLNFFAFQCILSQVNPTPTPRPPGPALQTNTHGCYNIHDFLSNWKLFTMSESYQNMEEGVPLVGEVAEEKQMSKSLLMKVAAGR